MLTYRYVIIGGGVTAGYAAAEFAKHGLFEGELCILSAEDTLPYDRPPLSKEYLAGEKSIDGILINEPEFYRQNGIEVKLETPATRVDLPGKLLYTQDDAIAYEQLLIATGARPRVLNVPGADLDNIFYLRTVKDASQIHRAASEAKKAVIVGGGFIGMEAASVLQRLGVDTTMVFPDARVWQSFFTEEMSDFFEAYYGERGVTILPNMTIDSFHGEGGVTHAITSTGRRIKADIVVVGIGVKPNTELFKDSGLQLGEDAIAVNRFLETNMPGVLAAGDVTRYKDILYDRPLHIEHWDNAVEQGRHAARVMLGEYQPYEHVPYFFSDEFDLSFDFWGDSQGAAEVVHRGDVQSGKFSVWWLAANGRLLAAFVMDRPKEESDLAPKWIESRKVLSGNWLRNEERLSPEPA
ncbi:MAG: NAD(P)/FAD-dependent oxidoreductase [Candidatus Promineifilaceae bacterium]